MAGSVCNSPCLPTRVVAATLAGFLLAASADRGRGEPGMRHGVM